MNPIIREATKKIYQLYQFMDDLVEAERPMDVTIKDGKVVYYDLETLSNLRLFCMLLN